MLLVQERWCKHRLRLSQAAPIILEPPVRRAASFKEGSVTARLAEQNRSPEPQPPLPHGTPCDLEYLVPERRGPISMDTTQTKSTKDESGAMLPWQSVELPPQRRYCFTGVCVCAGRGVIVWIEIRAEHQGNTLQVDLKASKS